MAFSFNMDQLALACTDPVPEENVKFKCACCGKDAELPKDKASPKINYCNAECKKQAGIKRGTWVTLKCTVCGNDFYAKKADASTRVVCGLSCRGTHRARLHKQAREASCRTA